MASGTHTSTESGPGAGSGARLRRAQRIRQAARRQFDAWSESYDRSLLNRFLFWPAYRVMLEEVADWHAQHRRSFRLLDVGCGTGTFASLVAAKKWPARVVGLDLSQAMCRQARNKASRTVCDRPPCFVNADSEVLPFADGSFDLVTCANSFHHYPHQQTVIEQIRRLLSPGGRLILLDGFRDNVIGWFVYDVLITRIEGQVHHAPWTEMRDLFYRAGFTQVRQRKYSLWMPGLATVGVASES